jgi:malate dehydrogenase (oxaloacetate-decarboxylating)(NADP+)
VFPEGEEPKILRASHILIHDQIAAPILLGNEDVIRQRARELNLHIEAAHVVDPAHSPQAAAYSEELHGLRQRKGVTAAEAERLVALPSYFAAMMLHRGDADVLVAGLTKDYSDVIRPALHVLPLRAGLRRVAGLHLMMPRDGTLYFFADTTVNIEPDAEDLAEIALMAADTAGHFNVTPRVAMLSFSNFGSTRHPLTEKVRRAVEIVRQRAPGLMVDGEMQGDTAVTPALIESTYPFSTLRGGANVLIFPNLEAANTAYTLVSRIGGTEAIGPILMGLSKPVHVLRRNAEVNDIVNLAAIAVVEAQQTVTK